MLTVPQGIEFSGLFSPLDIASRKSVIVAVSGGSDSTALLLLLKSHLDQVASATRLVAVTVDHALRPGSDREAADVAALCGRLGVAHRIATWSGAKPATGIPEAAREARHALLAGVAEVEGTDLVLTGHTADDQAETVLMRRSRGGASEGRGLAGIAPATLYDGRTWFARPLLGARRGALRGYLSGRGVGWIDDPTNVDLRYERPRQRKALSGSAGDVALEHALILARTTARQRQEAGIEAARLIREYVFQAAPSLLQLRTEFFREAGRDTSVYALRVLLAVAGGTVHLPDHERSAALRDRLSDGGLVRDTLAGVLVDARKTGVFLTRELRDLPDREAVPEGAIWDGRYRVLCAERADEVGRSGIVRPAPGDIPESLLRHAAATLPVPASGCLAIPVVAPWARYLPSFDLALARAVAELVGAPEIPDAPLRGHIESKA